jgi:D-ribose pyranose/furanose isomerase RbsD
MEVWPTGSVGRAGGAAGGRAALWLGRPAIRNLTKVKTVNVAIQRLLLAESVKSEKKQKKRNSNKKLGGK